MDEVVLALKSVSAGLCKLQQPQSTTRERILVAKEEQIEQLVSEVFCSQSEGGVVDDSVRLSIKVLCQLLIAHPDVCYWFNYFSSPPQVTFTIRTLYRAESARVLLRAPSSVTSFDPVAPYMLYSLVCRRTS
jgi:hypothetical protein